MRKCFMFVIAAAAIATLAGPASAEPSRPIGKHEPEAVMKACAEVGGTPILDRGITYGCQKDNCDGKGGTCNVECYNSTGECIGTCPTCGQALRRYDLIKILKASPAGPPGTGLLESTPGGSPSGPSGPGTSKPTTPPAGKLY